MQKSILTGNYEFYYAAGLIANLSGVEIPEDIKPEELLALLSEKIPTLTPADEKEKYLFGMWRTTVPKMYMMSRCGNF